MIGLVIVTHGQLAKEFLRVLEHVMGESQKQIATICIEAEDDMERRRADIETAVDAMNTGSGVIILTDLFGGTPSNMAISMTPNVNVEVIAGINLPLLVHLSSVRNTLPLNEAALSAQKAGRKYMEVASALLDRNPAS